MLHAIINFQMKDYANYLGFTLYVYLNFNTLTSVTDDR